MAASKATAKADTVENRDGKPALHVRFVHDIEEHVTRVSHDMRPESTAARASDDYFRRERMPPTAHSNGGHEMNGGHAPTGGDGGGLAKTAGIIVLVLLGLWLLSYTPLWTGNWHGDARGFVPTATATYAGPAVARQQQARPRRVIPPGTGQVTINREFDDGQSYCSKYLPGTTFEHWNGSGPTRSAHCVD